MDILIFTIVGAALYLGSDWLLRRLERSRGRAFEHRSLVFLAIILPLALVSFEVIGRLLRG